MIGWLAAGALAYGAAVGSLFLAQRSLMYFPDREMPVRSHWNAADMEVVELRTADGLVLTGWHRRPTRPGRPTVVLFHGNAGHLGMRAFKARVFLEAGYGVLLAPYRGFGGNPGQPSEEGLYRDARAALDHLEGLGVTGPGVVLYGESLGTGVAVQMATERAVAAVILEAPFTAIADVAATHFRLVPVRPLIRDRYDNLSKIRYIRAPLLVIHGEHDITVPVRFGRRLFAAAREPKRALFLPRAGHNDVYEYGAGDAALAFLQEVVRTFPGPGH